MHKTNCMQSIKNISTWEVFSSICPKKMKYFKYVLVEGHLVTISTRFKFHS